MCESAAKRFLHACMHSCESSIATRCLHSFFRNSVQRPWPQAISSMVLVGKKDLMRGRIVPNHSMLGLPQHSDHSSPRDVQRYSPSHMALFSSTVGMPLTVRIETFSKPARASMGRSLLARLQDPSTLARS